MASTAISAAPYRRFQNTAVARASVTTSATTVAAGPRRSTRGIPRSEREISSERRLSCSHHFAAPPSGRIEGDTSSRTNSATTEPPRSMPAHSAGLSDTRRSSLNHTTDARPAWMAGSRPAGRGRTESEISRIPLLGPKVHFGWSCDRRSLRENRLRFLAPPE